VQEVVFLRQNAEKWKQFEALLRDRKSVDPDALAKGFVEVTDDLAYARTFYPVSKTTQYLNGLAAEVHQALYLNKKEDRGRIIRFWKVELPLEIRRSHRELMLSFFVFALAAAVGVLSAAHDPGFVRLVLGDHYVNMTLANIDQGDPMAVYGQMNQFDMFFSISLNNIWVAFMAFSMGVLFSFGSVYILLKNGLMLGVFHYLFYQHDLLLPSLLVVYIHGTLEISVIIIAGAAGMVMGNSLLFPGSYPRRAAFVRGAKRGLKIVIGLVPIFVVAGFLEGFVTRSEMPVALSLSIILCSLSFIVWYFGVYPVHVAKRQPHGIS